MMIKKITDQFALIAVLILAGIFRLAGVNWDASTHLHPDERFFTMVTTAMKIPVSFSQYLDPATSLMNPANIGYKFYVYGLLPATINKITAIIFGNDTYNLITLQGRVISALFDIGVVLFVYKIVLLFEPHLKLKPYVKYFAAFCYAIAVFPIQISHYYAVDTFLNLFVIASFYFALQYYYERRYRSVMFSALCVGLALCCKVTVVYIIPLIGVLYLLTLKKKNIRSLFYITLIYIAVVYTVVRIGDPYYFESSNFLNAQPSVLYMANLKELKRFDTPDAWFPPSNQWAHTTPVIFSLKNLSLYGLGMGLFLLALAGAVLTVARTKRRRVYWPLAITVVWVGGFFLYQSTQFVKSIRYFILLYPFLAIYAGISLSYLYQKFMKFGRAGAAVIGAIGLALLMWPVAFISIYVTPHSRMQASEWMYANIPPGSAIAVEHWDDALPLSYDGKTATIYQFLELPVFGPDDPAKWQVMNTLLNQADYYVLSSNRGWGSILSTPERYPKMVRLYQDLFAGRLPFKKVHESVSYPSLRYLGIPVDFPDTSAEETFTVYDHPQVLIFKKQKP